MFTAAGRRGSAGKGGTRGIGAALRAQVRGTCRRTAAGKWPSIDGDWQVYRLRPGEERWTSDGWLSCASDFERDATGTLWATCSKAVCRLSAGRWSIAWDGLATTDGSGRCEDLTLAEDGALLLAVEEGGVFRRTPGASS